MPDHTLLEQAERFNAAWTDIAAALYVDARPGEGLDVTDAQLLVLYTIASSGPLRAGQLADRVGLLGPSLSRMLGVLDERGLVQRERDTDDGRATLVSLTVDGRALVQRHRGRLVDAVARMLAHLHAPERAEAVSIMERLRRLTVPGSSDR